MGVLKDQAVGWLAKQGLTTEGDGPSRQWDEELNSSTLGSEEEQPMVCLADRCTMPPWVLPTNGADLELERKCKTDPTTT